VCAPWTWACGGAGSPRIVSWAGLEAEPSLGSNIPTAPVAGASAAAIAEIVVVLLVVVVIRRRRQPIILGKITDPIVCSSPLILL
jgi:hypothetical protein